MKTHKRHIVNSQQGGGAKRLFVLFVSSLVFALPFMTKSLCAITELYSLTAFFGWCGLSALFVSVFGFENTLKRVMSSLFCFFFVFYFFVYSWFINLYPLDFAGLGSVESIAVIVAAVTLIPLLHGAVMTVCVFVSYLASRFTESVILKSVIVGAGYVLGEYLQSLGTFAFPWARLFVGQTAFPFLLQTASLFGSYFITFVMVTVNVLIAFCVLNVSKDKKKSRLCALTAAVIFTANALFGVVRMNTLDFTGCETLDAVVLQGNISSSEKWAGEVDEREVYLDLAEWAKSYRMAKEYEADIAVIPETAFPVTIDGEDAYLSRYERTAFDIAELLGCELFVGAFNKEDGKSYNSIFVFGNDGSISEPYNKYNIVPFGEFLPYRNVIEKLFPSLAEINMISSDISRGDSFVPIETKAGKAACLVCFDSIFPDTSRRQVKNGADYIVVSTNDSWYKTSSAIYQHADHAVMRAIENCRPVIRCANTGISRIISPLGQVREETRVNERTAISGGVYMPKTTTLYTRIGDIFVGVCAFGIVLVLLFGSVNKKRASHKM